MFRDEKNLKDSQKDSLPNTDIALKDGLFPFSYTKTNKLITALYMVTDIVDKEEPLRAKLRTLGIEIISDTYSLSAQAGAPHRASGKISEVVSLLGIARALNIISSMNCDILEKEFYQLDHSIKELAGETKVPNAPVDLGEFFKEVLSAPKSQRRFPGVARLGVQKGSTLMKALSGVEMPARPIGGSDRNFVPVKPILNEKHPSELKGHRRNDILNIIKINGGNATIKDIKDKILTMSDKNNPLIAVGEKTLQRELLSMVEDGVLKKTGEKRWSRYFIA